MRPADEPRHSSQPPQGRDVEFDQRITTRISAKALRELIALSALRAVPVSSCVRTMLDHFLGEVGERSSKIERIKKLLIRPRRER